MTSAEVGHDLTKIKKDLKTELPKLKQIADTRREMNEKKREILTALEENHGLNRKAVQDAMKFDRLPDSQKDGYDLSYQIAREVLGKPWQPDMFMTPPDAAKDAKDEAAGKPADQGGAAAAAPQAN